MACGWRTAPECDEPCLSRAIQEGSTGGMRLFLPVECGVESLFDQTLSDAKHGIHTDGEALSYLLIRPGRTLHIGFQQDIGMSYLVGCGFPFPGYLGQLAAFLSRKTYEVLFVHGTLRLSARSCLRRNDNLLTHKNKTDKPLVEEAKKGGAFITETGRLHVTDKQLLKAKQQMKRELNPTYYQKYREEKLAYQKNYNKQHREKMLAYNRDYKRRKRQKRA
jgi:hypothetical protein